METLVQAAADGSWPAAFALVGIVFSVAFCIAGVIWGFVQMLR